MLPKVSVIIPAFNVEKYVKKAIESVLNQTYPNLEVIVVDDGSTDSTFEIVKKLQSGDARLKLYKNEKNLNIVHTLNRALQYATGAFIARMDGDDISEPDRISKQINFLLQNDDVDLVGSHSYIIDENDQVTGELLLPVTHEECLSVVKVISPVSHIWVAKKALYDKLNGYRNVPGAEDYDFILRTLTAGGRIANYDEKLYRVRIRSGNTNSTLGLKQFKTFKYVLGLYKERVKHGRDTFSEMNLENSIRSYALTETLYKRSFSFLRKAREYKNNKQHFCRYTMLLLYLIVCPYSSWKIYKNLVLSLKSKRTRYDKKK